jgi:hypothetical protein
VRTLRAQRGQLLVAGIVLIAAIALLIATLGYLYVSGESAGSLHSQSERAYFAARSGIQYAAAQYYNGTACSSLAGQPVGGGSFTLTPTLYAPQPATTTSAALTAGATTVTVASTAGYAPSGRILIDSELINYTTTTATSFDGVTRGVEGTTAAAHASGAVVSQNVCSVASQGIVGAANRTVRAALGSATSTGTNANAGALGTMGPDAMVVYGKGTALTGGGSDNNVYYRLWDGSSNNWGAEQTAQAVNGSPVFIVVQFARTRNEALMGVLDGSGRLYLQVWNGRTWTIPAGGGPLVTGLSTAGRGFQIAYEYTSDQGLIVYTDNSRNPRYVAWNGSTLSASATVHGALGLGNYPTSGVPRWFRLAPRRFTGSDEILMLSFDANQDIYAARWTGATWTTMGGVTTTYDTSVGDANNREAIDIAWESDFGRALLFWGDNTTRQVAWRTWTPATSTLGAKATVQFTFPGGYSTTTANGRFQWVRLYAGPNKVIIAVLQDAARALLAALWNSGASTFGSLTGIESDNNANPANGVESAASRSFNFSWETSPAASGKGWLLWGSVTSGGMQTKYFTSPSTWGASSSIRDRTLLLNVGTLLPSGRFVAGVYHSTNAAVANRTTESVTTAGGGAAWPNAATTLWPGQTTLQQGERVFVVTRDSGFINTGASGTGIVSVLQQQEVVP